MPRLLKRLKLPNSTYHGVVNVGIRKILNEGKKGEKATVDRKGKVVNNKKINV